MSNNSGKSTHKIEHRTSQKDYSGSPIQLMNNVNLTSSILILKSSSNESTPSSSTTNFRIGEELKIGSLTTSSKSNTFELCQEITDVKNIWPPLIPGASQKDFSETFNNIYKTLMKNMDEATMPEWLKSYSLVV